MKALFLIFHGLNPANGISKKIYYQVNALRACGIDTRLCYLNESNGRKLRMIDSEVLQDYGAGFKGKILKRIEYSSIVEYAKKENISLFICDLIITLIHSRFIWFIKCVKRG